MACAPLRRATLRAAHAALRRAAGSAHGARLVTSQAHDLTSACSRPAVPWAAPAPSSLRVDVVSCVRSLPDLVPLRDPPRNGELSPSRQ